MKKKRTQARVSFLIGVLFFCVLFSLASLLIAFAIPQVPRYPSSHATAEYLEEYALQAPPFIQVDYECLNNAAHCFRLMPEILVRNAFDATAMQRRIRTLYLRIDGEVRLDFNVQMDGAQIYGEIPLYALASGLHLIEVEVQDKDKRFYRHQWVIRIGNGIAAPATQALPPTMVTATP